MSFSWKDPSEYKAGIRHQRWPQAHLKQWWFEIELVPDVSSATLK